jgi:diketogulonate reductase-like aldo/keto reductase
MSSSEHGQPLIPYVSATHSAVSGALVVEKEIMKVLTGSKKYYPEMEKICYAVIMRARKLHHYFELHAIKVLTNQPLNDIFGNRDSSVRISKWVMNYQST